MLDCLDGLEPGSGNEIQLTDGIARLLAREPVFAYSYVGKRYDCGSKLGFLEATLEFALKHPKLGADFQQLVNRASETAGQEAAMAGAQGTRSSRHLTLVSS